MLENDNKAFESVVESQENSDFLKDLANSTDSKKADTLVNKKLNEWKTDLVAKNFDKVASKINDTKKLKWYVNKIEEKWNLSSLSKSVNYIMSSEVVKHIMDKVSNSIDANVVDSFSKNCSADVINKLDAKWAKQYINNVDKFGCLQNMASWINKISNKEVVKDVIEKVNDSHDGNVVTKFAKSITAPTINKIEPNNAISFVNNVAEKWGIGQMASKISGISNKEVSKNIVNKVTEKWDSVALKTISNNLDEWTITSMNKSEINKFARKSLMKGGQECAVAMAWNNHLMKKLDEGTSSLIMEQANSADADLKKNLSWL